VFFENIEIARDLFCADDADPWLRNCDAQRMCAIAALLVVIDE
jgi:hypothetical protein